MVQMFLKKDKIQKLVGHCPNKKDISKIIQENPYFNLFVSIFIQSYVNICHQIACVDPIRY
jgi:hypothetical protein